MKPIFQNFAKHSETVPLASYQVASLVMPEKPCSKGDFISTCDVINNVNSYNALKRSVFRNFGCHAAPVNWEYRT